MNGEEKWALFLPSMSLSVRWEDNGIGGSRVLDDEMGVGEDPFLRYRLFWRDVQREALGEEKYFVEQAKQDEVFDPGMEAELF